MTADEIIADLNTKYFVGQVTSGGACYTRVVVEDVDGNLYCESFTEFRKRFPEKRLINGRMQNVGSFWLKNPRRRQQDQIIYRERFARKESERWTKSAY